MNTNQQLEMVISTITLLNTIYQRTTESTGLNEVRYQQYKLLSATHSGKLSYQLRTNVTQPLPTCTIQTTY